MTLVQHLRAYRKSYVTAAIVAVAAMSALGSMGGQQAPVQPPQSAVSTGEIPDVGVHKVTVSPGDGVNFPKKGDQISMEYTGWTKENYQDGKGPKPFDSSVPRGDFKATIGLGQLIKGWDEGIIGTAEKPGMSLGERAILHIRADYGYGPRGFPGLIPPNSPLIFNVRLKGIQKGKDMLSAGPEQPKSAST